MSSLKIIYVFGLCLLWGSGVTAQTLEQFEQRLDQELTKIEQRTDTALKKLRNSYLGALIRLERDARQSGDHAASLGNVWRAIAGERAAAPRF